MRRAALFLLLSALLALPALAFAQGVEGRASLWGKLGEKIEIRAYEAKSGAFGTFTGEKIAAKTYVKPDGTFRLSTPPGRYVIDGIWKKPGNVKATPEPGDGYCVYSGSPVVVAAGRWSAAGLYLTEVKPETRAPAQNSSIGGVLTFKGKPAERVYLYLYTSPSGDFRGPADISQPVEAGTFNVRVSPGTYYLVARKRSQGGSYGPIATGDLFNFHAQNPVTVKAGEKVSLEIQLIEKLSQVEETGVYKGLKITVTDGAGKPLPNHYALAYAKEERSGHPAATAGPTGGDGAAYLNAPPEARFLRVRKQIGGPPEPGEKFTDYAIPPGAKEVKIVFSGKGSAR